MRRPTLPFLLLVAIACQKTGKVAERKVPEPADLIAVVSVASPKAALDRFKAYAEAVSPGAGGVMKEEMIPAALATMIGAPSLAGLDLGKPMHLLVLDPKKHEHPLLLAAVADAQKVKATTGAKVAIEGDRALIGPAADVDSVAAYAFGVVAARTAPAAPTATCSPAKLAALYRADIEKLRQDLPRAMAAQASMARILSMELDLFLKLAEQTDEARFALDAAGGEASADVAFVPRAGSSFEKWAKGQSPGIDPALLARLPGAEHPTILMVGKVSLGPVRAAILDFSEEILAQWLGKKPDRAQWNAFLDGFDGTLAAVMWSDAAGAMNLDELAGAADGARTLALAKELFAVPPGQAPRELAGMKMTWEGKPEATHDGVTIIGYEVRPDYASLPEMQRDMLRRIYGDAMRMNAAGFDKWLVMSLGPDAPARVGHVIDVVRKGGGLTVSGGAKDAFEAARGRKASFAFFMDVPRSMAAILPQTSASTSGLLMELGVSDGTTHFRIGMPAAHVREIMATFGGGR